MARKRVLAELMAEFVTTGRATMPDGVRLDASPKDWIETVKWVYAHIDGQAKQALEVTGADGGLIEVAFVNYRAGLTGLETGSDEDSGAPGED